MMNAERNVHENCVK